MKLLRTIRLDQSDTLVFERAAEPGEWAVSGGFVFCDEDITALQGKARAAFRGVGSLGWSTLVQIVEAQESDRLAAVETLARQLIANFGAPTMEAAKAAAEDEFAFANTLCTHPAADTLIAVHRVQENGEIREAYRNLRFKGGRKPPRAFAFLEVEDEEEPAERIDLAALGREINK